MKKKYLEELTATPGKVHHVADYDTAYTCDMDKATAAAMQAENIAQLTKLQDKLYAHDRYALLIVFQAMDAAGKDGTIKHVMSGVNPQGCQVFSFKQPTKIDLDHGYLWRIQQHVPERGRIGIFNRSHYEDVLIGRVHPEIIASQQIPGITQVQDLDKTFWQRRYQHINNFERYLHESGTEVVKFFLHVSKEEQKKRFMERLNDKRKNWKFSASDLKERGYWDDYMKAYSQMITATSTEEAPWYVIPADHKWFMRYAVSAIIVERLKALKTCYPELSHEAEAALEGYKTALQQEPD